MAVKVWVTMDMEGTVEIYAGRHPRFEKTEWWPYYGCEFVMRVCDEWVKRLGLKLEPGDCIQHEVALTPVKKRKAVKFVNKVEGGK